MMRISATLFGILLLSLLLNAEQQTAVRIRDLGIRAGIFSPGRLNAITDVTGVCDPGVSEISTNNLFDKIHSDPRWLPFLRKIGRSPDQLAKIKFHVPLPKNAEPSK